MRKLAMVLPIAALACGGTDAPSEETAWVFFDRPAQAAGMALIDGTDVLPATALPLELQAPGDASVARLPQGRPLRRDEPMPAPAQLAPLGELHVEAGEALLVRGVEGNVVRGVADPDELILVGSEPAARDFAALFGARLTLRDGWEQAATIGQPEQWSVRGPDILSLASLLDARQVADLEGISPVITSGEGMQAQHGEHEQLQRAGEERAAIGRALVVVVGMDGPPVVEVGKAIPLTAKLMNVSHGPRAVVRPGDGSSMGWREPLLYWSAEREVRPGVWQPVATRSYSRCGNFDGNWRKDVMMLEPGQALPFEWGAPPESTLEIRSAGKYRFYARYEYRGGKLGRSGLGMFGGDGETAPDNSHLLDGVPPFEVVSEPMEVRIEPGLELEVRPTRTPLALSADARPSDLFEVYLSNRSTVSKALPRGGIERIDIQVIEQEGAWGRMWFSVTPRLAESVLAPGTRVRLDGSSEPIGVHEANRSRRPGHVHVRAGAYLSYDNRDYVELRSAPVAVQLAPPE